MFNLFKTKHNPNKTQYVLDLLESGERVTQYGLYKRHFHKGAPMPTRLSGIIFALKRRGKVIHATRKKGRDGTYCEYWMEGK